MEQVNSTDVLLKALKERAKDFMFYDNETEKENMIRLFEAFGDDVDGFCYIREMHLLSKAVSFYMMYSDDHIETKKSVQNVFEQVIKNDYTYKEIADYLFIFRDALGDVYDKLKENTKTDN